jgi:uncharacterized membrane protein
MDTGKLKKTTQLAVLSLSQPVSNTNQSAHAGNTTGRKVLCSPYLISSTLNLFSVDLPHFWPKILFIYSFICGLLNDAVSISDYVISNDGMM